MHCTDTDSQPVVRLEHLRVRNARKINKLIGYLKRNFQGNGRLLLIVNGGKIADYELTGKEPPEDTNTD